MRARIIFVVLFSIGLSVLWVPAANAYLDPGSGSFIFQSLIGILLAAGFAIKVFWKRIVSLFKGRSRKAPDA